MLNRYLLGTLLITLVSMNLGAHEYSPRTLSIALTLSKSQATLHSYTLKNHAFAMQTTQSTQSFYEFGNQIPLRLTLSGPNKPDFVRELKVGALCLDHDAHEPPHILGDTIYLHQDTFIVEMPELPGYDTVLVELARSQAGIESAERLGSFKLDRAHFDASIHGFNYEDLAFANKHDKSQPQEIKANTVIWPEAFADSTKFKVYGDVTEGKSRINILIIPDGYTYAQKATMEQHAQALVQAFRNKTPYKEHDHLINYTLVYAYSNSSGTDQCDCGIVLNTAMGTGFQKQSTTCGSSSNRCLYYTNPCDSSVTSNIIAAEQRAPYADTTIIMVNTSRYGGCGGARAVYSAGNASATEVAIHELGHSLGGLADEYGGNPACGSSARNINTSLNATQGSWPEWILELGAPKLGGQYYDKCIYRPEETCQMRQLGQPFCRVCNQHFSKVFYAHPRVAPTSPLKNPVPTQTNISLALGAYATFKYETRLSTLTNVQNSWAFFIKAPGQSNFTNLGAYKELQIRFTLKGVYEVKAEVVADINFIKPQKTGANKDVVLWQVNVGASQSENLSPVEPPADLGYEIISQN